MKRAYRVVSRDGRLTRQMLETAWQALLADAPLTRQAIANGYAQVDFSACDDANVRALTAEARPPRRRAAAPPQPALTWTWTRTRTLTLTLQTLTLTLTVTRTRALTRPGPDPGQVSWPTVCAPPPHALALR